MADDTLARMFWARVERGGGGPAQRFKRGGAWQTLSWREVGDITREVDAMFENSSAATRTETERAFQAFARSGVDRLELHADAPGAAAADAALHAAAHASVEVGALAADEKVQVQRRVRCERDGRLQHQAARSDVEEPRAHDEHGLGQLGRLEARGLAALGLVGASGAHGTSRTTRKPQSAARACGSRHEREPGFSSRAGWRHDPPRLTRASPDSGPRGS
jgi:hypothetical protein